MLLLVSVSDGIEASAALSGGADIVDAKDPAAGPLGAVSLGTFDTIGRAVRSARPLTAALGDLHGPAVVEAEARSFVRSGATLVKVGFAGIASADAASRLIDAAVRGAACGTRERRTQPYAPYGVVAVAYADADRAHSPTPDDLLAPAARAGALGILIDTFDKNGPGLRGLMTAGGLAAWVRRAHDAGLLAALAGRIGPEDMAWVRASGADIVGVRGAACDGGRNGRVTSDNVRQLRLLCHQSAHAAD